MEDNENTTSNNQQFPVKYFVYTVIMYAVALGLSILILHLVCKYSCKIYQQIYYITLILPLIIVGFIVIKLGAKAQLEYEQAGIKAKLTGIVVFITLLLFVGTFKIDQPNCCTPPPPCCTPPSCEKYREVLRRINEKVICNQYVDGNNLVLQFKGAKDFYKLGEYDFSNNQHIKILADLVGSIYNDFDSLASNEPSFFVDMQISASADGNTMNNTIVYTGTQQMDCECYIKGTSQSNIETLIPNNKQVNGYLLGCARAAYFANYLLNNKNVEISHLKLTGRELELKGGEYRNISVTITLNNLLKVYSEEDMCIICE